MMSDSATSERVVRVVGPVGVDGSVRSRRGRLLYGCWPRNLMSIRRGSQRRLGRPSAVIAGATVTDSTVSLIRRRHAASRCAGSRSLLTDDRRLAAPRLPRRTNLAPPATPISLCCFSLGCGVVPGDDVRLRDGRQRCASPTTRGCRRKREQSLPAASLWLLAQEPDVDPATVPEATGATIRSHRRRDRDRLDGVGDQPSPRR